MDTLNEAEVRTRDLEDWRQLGSLLATRYRTPDFATGLSLLDRIGALAEAASHHPDVALSYDHLDLRLTSHDAGGITQRDVDLARAISVLAAEAGVGADLASLTIVHLGLDASFPARVRPFWSALVGATDTGEDVRDPDGAVPSIWFQEPDVPTPAGAAEQRWHLDVLVAHDQADSRIKAAIEAGGTLVDDTSAPSFWVLADADGNRSCICTSQPSQSA